MPSSNAATKMSGKMLTIEMFTSRSFQVLEPGRQGDGDHPLFEIDPLEHFGGGRHQKLARAPHNVDRIGRRCDDIDQLAEVATFLGTHLESDELERVGQTRARIR